MIKIFDSLAKLFNSHGFRLYVIGGTSRDYLLNKELTDYDFVTDATPDEMKVFIPDANYRFEMYGSIRLKVGGIKVDITTLRKEDEYLDKRHPSQIVFTKNLKEDSKRRDFTINAIYIDEKYNVIDFYNGEEDLKNKIIRFIGDPYKRINEDPLRIIRAIRFKEVLNFEFESETNKAINDLFKLTETIKKEKLDEERRKGYK